LSPRGRNEAGGGSVRGADNHLGRRSEWQNREAFLEPRMDVIALIIGEQNEGGASAQAASVKRRDAIASDIDDGHIRADDSRVLPFGQCLTQPDDFDIAVFAKPSAQPRQNERRR